MTVYFFINYLYNTNANFFINLQATSHVVRVAGLLVLMLSGCSHIHQLAHAPDATVAQSYVYDDETLAALEQTKIMTQMVQSFIFSPNLHDSIIDLSDARFYDYSPDPSLQPQADSTIHSQSYDLVFEDNPDYSDSNEGWGGFPDGIGIGDPSTSTQVLGNIYLRLNGYDFYNTDTSATVMYGFETHSYYSLQDYEFSDKHMEIYYTHRELVNNGRQDQDNYYSSGDIAIQSKDDSGIFFQVDNYVVELETTWLLDTDYEYNLEVYQFEATFPFEITVEDKVLQGSFTYVWTDNELTVHGDIYSGDQLIGGFKHIGSLNNNNFQVVVTTR